LRGFEKQYAEYNILNHERGINVSMEKITSEEHFNSQSSSNIKAFMIQWSGIIVCKVEKIDIVWSRKSERKNCFGDVNVDERIR
jgi:hypothetical protein